MPAPHQRPADQQPHLPVRPIGPAVPILDDIAQAAKLAGAPLGLVRDPFLQQVEPAQELRHDRALDQHRQIAPAIIGGDGEVMVRDIGTARHHPRAIGDHELLVVAHQIALAPLGREDREGAASLLQRGEELGARIIAEIIHDQIDRHPALCGSDQRVAHHRAGDVTVEQVVEQFEAVLRPIN